jgi:hypothetical protein
VAYSEFTAPSDPGIQIVDRVLVRVPDVIVLVWLRGCSARRRRARGAALGRRRPDRCGPSFRSVRQVLGVRGIATLLATSLVLGGMCCSS